MASNLPSDTELGQIGASLIRVASLDSDCTVTGGSCGGFITTALTSVNPEPDIEEGTVFEPKTAGGVIFYTFRRPDLVKRVNITAEMIGLDPEQEYIMFGGTKIIGDAGSVSPSDVIGYALPDYSDTPYNGVYFEVIRQQIAKGAGDCVDSSGAWAPYVGHIFGKCKFTKGGTTMEDAPGSVSVTGFGVSNPNLYDGPWNDWPGGAPNQYIPRSPWIEIGYSQAAFDAMLALAGAGCIDLATGS